MKKTSRDEETNIELDLTRKNFNFIPPYQGVLEYINEKKFYFGAFIPTKTQNGDTTEMTEHHAIILCGNENGEPAQIMLTTRTNQAINNFRLTVIPLQTRQERWTSSAIQKIIMRGAEKIDGKRLLYKISDKLKFYFEFSDPKYYDLVATWILGTYVHQLFESYPYLFIHGEKNCGKSKLMQFLSVLAFFGIYSGNVSPSSIYRLIQASQCTLLIDETETLTNVKDEKAQEIRNLLLNGYKKGALVYRQNTDNKQIKTEEFETYSPKAIANIKGLEDVLESRCITIVMQRTLNKEIGEREVKDTDEELLSIRNECYAWALQQWKDIKEIYEIVENPCESVKNRDWELIKPLYGLAKLYDEQVASDFALVAQSMAESKSLDEQASEKIEYHVLDALSFYLDDVNKEIEKIRLKDVINVIKNRMENPPDWIRAKYIAGILKRMGFGNKSKDGQGVYYIISKDELDMAASRLNYELGSASKDVKQVGTLV